MISPASRPRTCLGDVAAGRDNNFNLIRLGAAVAVLVSHAWPIAKGPGAVQPLETLTGHTLGSLAVFLFFTISGFFITGSYARRRSAAMFLRARALRLFPGLAVSIVLVALVMGPLVTGMPVLLYLTDPGTYTFILRNITLAIPQYTLPGVFTDLPYPSVEGSIWTLIHEVLCYGMVFLAGLSGLLLSRRAMTAALLVYAALWAVPFLWDLPLHPRLAQTHALSFPFVIGVAFWVWRARIVLSGRIALGLILLAGLARQTDLAFPMITLALGYAAFWCAYVPRGRIRAATRWGDYSYGVYIYAFPLQGLVIWIWGEMGPGLNIALSLPLTLICAIASWHLIERPALAFARR